MFKIFLAFLLGTTTLGAQDSLSDAYALELLRTLTDTIGYYHPAAQYPDDRAAYEEAYERAKKRLLGSTAAPGDSIGIQAFVLAAGEVQRQLRCGHLQLYPVRGKKYNKEVRRRRRYAATLTSNDKFVLTRPFFTGIDTLPRGTEILTIDGRPALELITELATFRGTNDEGYEGATIANTSRGMSSLYQSRYGRKDTLYLTYLDLVSDEPKSIAIGMALTEAELAELPEDEPEPTKKEKKAAKKERKATLHTNYIKLNKSEDSTAWILRISSFSGKAYRYVNFNKILKRKFDTISASGLDKLILDLRYNGGGDIVNARTLVRYFAEAPFAVTDEVVSTSPTANGKGFFNKAQLRIMGGVRKREDGVYHFKVAEATVKPFKDRFSGDVVAIINEGSFSATGIVANALMELDAATVIGTRTGGGRSALFGGKIRDLKIGDPDEIQFQVRAPNWRYVPLNATPGTVTPEIIVPITKQDLLDEVDPQMNAALEILNGRTVR
ncbi:S41 family peptidase [Lewinella sp. 4G2]|uniref:S41 family peptidase n=1 Tax=Lewinella sp. 4G2 TaxID=1803372 RepID=UPI0007B474B0|nr:S41 family peptidase [Lewinella sp. 4G2]OAV45525.1 hypothetical protein A3850_013950 [Lewinella sp. 4G2]